MVTTPHAPGVRPTLKYQPKSSTRRSKEEREAQERAEEERRLARLGASGGSVLTSGNRGGLYGRGGRGGLASAGFRGGMSGWRFEPHGSTRQASGPLGGGSSVPVVTSKRKGTRGDVKTSDYSLLISSTSQQTPLATKSKKAIKAETEKGSDVPQRGSVKRRDPTIKKEDQILTYVSSEDELDPDEGPRVNIEHINLVSDEEIEEDPTHAKGKEREKLVRQPGWSLKPIRIDRKEHVERAIGVNTDASSLTSAELRKRAKARGEAEGSLFLPLDEAPDAVKKTQSKVRAKNKDVEFLRDKRRWKGVYQDDEDEQDGTRVKEEPGDEDGVMNVDVADTPTGATGEFTAIAGGVPAKAAAERPPEEPAEEDQSATVKVRRRRKLAFGDLKPVLQTAEDREEWVRYKEDVIMLGEELGSMDPGPQSSAVMTDAEGNILMDEDLDEKKDRKEGLVYLFQFPPIVPDLVPQDEGSAVEEAQRLGEPMSAPAELSKETASTGSAKKGTPAINPDGDLSRQGIEKVSNTFMAQDTDVSSGYAGMLTVYESGAVIIEWGDSYLELARGGEGELLQDVITSDVNSKIKDQDVGEGCDKSISSSGMSMGQLTGGFVVTPDWTSMFDGG